MSGGAFETRSRRDRDGYERTTWRCKGCGKKVASISVGNG